MLLDQRACMRPIGAFAKKEHDLAFLTGRQRHAHLHRTAGIQTSPELAVKSVQPHGGGICKCSVPTDESLAVARRRREWLARMREGDAAAKFAVVAVPREEAARLAFTFG